MWWNPLIPNHIETYKLVKASKAPASRCFQYASYKCRVQNMKLHMVVVDLIKTFDIVNQKDFWKILQTFGCPQKLVSLVTSFQYGMKDWEQVPSEKWSEARVYHDINRLLLTVFCRADTCVSGLWRGGVHLVPYWWQTRWISVSWPKQSVLSYSSRVSLRWWFCRISSV